MKRPTYRALELALVRCYRDLLAGHLVDSIVYEEKHPERPRLPEPASMAPTRKLLQRIAKAKS